MDRSKNVVIIPAYNEQRTIGQVVEGLLPFANVIVVNDRSTDETARVALAAGAEVITHEVNQGYEGALETGFQTAAARGFENLVTFDADGQHSSETALTFFRCLELPGVELVLGVRPRKARIAESLMGFYFRIRFGIEDVLCGLKGYKLATYKNVGYFDRMKTVGGEIILAAAKRKTVFVQLPVPITERVGESRFGNSLRGNLKILKALGKLVRLDVGLLPLE